MRAARVKSFRLFPFINKYFGWRNWAVLNYNSVIENVFILFYIALSRELYSFEFIIDFFMFFLFSSFCTTIGYLMNDFGDKELDKLHGKDNTFSDDSSIKAGAILLLFLTLSIISGIRFFSNPLFTPLWLLWLGITIAYSVKPIRLKEKGKIGLIFVVIAQRILPIVLIFFAFRHYDWIDVCILTFYIFFRGLSSDLNHQLVDYSNDSKTETNTYAVKAGLTKAQKIFNFSLEIEKILLIFCLLRMYVELTHVRVFNVPLMLLMLICYIFLYLLQLIRARTQGDAQTSDPFNFERKDRSQFMHHVFPSVLLPLFLVILLVSHSIKLLPLLIFFVWYRKLYSLEYIRNSYPLKRVFKYIRSG